jgi:hypothetical protein
MRAWDDYFHLRAALATFDFQAAAELFHSFAHSYDSDADAFAWSVTVQQPSWYTPPMINYRKDQPLVRFLNLDFGFVAPGMQVNICKTSLDDAEDREFRFFG